MLPSSRRRTFPCSFSPDVVNCQVSLLPVGIHSWKYLTADYDKLSKYDLNDDPPFFNFDNFIIAHKVDITDSFIIWFSTEIRQEAPPDF